MEHSPISIAGILRANDRMTFQGTHDVDALYTDWIIIKSSYLHMTNSQINRLILLPPALILWVYEIARVNVEIQRKPALARFETRGWLTVEGDAMGVEMDASQLHNIDYTAEDIQPIRSLPSAGPNNVWLEFSVPMNGLIEVKEYKGAFLIDPVEELPTDVILTRTDSVVKLADIFNEDGVLA